MYHRIRLNHEELLIEIYKLLTQSFRGYIEEIKMAKYALSRKSVRIPVTYMVKKRNLHQTMVKIQLKNK